MRKNKIIYHPSRVFDDRLDGLVRLFKTKGWSFSNVDQKQLEKDVAAQRTERAEFDAVSRTYERAKQLFATAQAERHRRFASALSTAEGAFRDDPAVMSELQQFKRPGGRKKGSKNPPSIAPKAA